VRVRLWPPSKTRVDAPEPPPALPDKPSIVVLPFTNMSGDVEQEYFSDGITEDLTTALSRFDWLFVIARNSAFTYKGEAVDVKRVGRELGVRYVLEGSIRRSGERVRVNAQLIDAGADRHVWAERFDRQIDDVFELQDDIVARIATTVGPEITLAEIERARVKRPDTLDAWDHYLRALAAFHKMTKDDVADAISLLNEALDIEPNFANASALLGLCHRHIGMYGWVRPARQAFDEARQIAKHAVRLAPSSPETNQALALMLWATGESEQAVTRRRTSPWALLSPLPANWKRVWRRAKWPNAATRAIPGEAVFMTPWGTSISCSATTNKRSRYRKNASTRILRSLAPSYHWPYPMPAWIARLTPSVLSRGCWASSHITTFAPYARIHGSFIPS
jgi:TolB-like protein